MVGVGEVTVAPARTCPAAGTPAPAGTAQAIGRPSTTAISNLDCGTPRGTRVRPPHSTATDGGSTTELVDRVCDPAVAVGGADEAFDSLTAVPGGRGAEWHATLEDGQRPLDTHHASPSAPGTDGEGDARSDGGSQ